jgi:phosphatidylserine decarboxylase
MHKNIENQNLDRQKKENSIAAHRSIVAREGYPIIIIPLLLCIFTIPLLSFWFSLPLLIFSCFSAWFFRNPEREIPSDPDIFVSPADGKVLIVEKVREDRYLFREMQKISIFMSLIDVHINRIPKNGLIVNTIYHPGRFFSAYTDKAGMHNEQHATVIKDKNGYMYMFVQIAGFIARRIVNYAEAGMEVKTGQRVGLIRFGSRLDVYLPLEVEVFVSAGQKVRAGESILGRLA